MPPKQITTCDSLKSGIGKEEVAAATPRIETTGPAYDAYSHLSDEEAKSLAMRVEQEWALTVAEVKVWCATGQYDQFARQADVNAVSAMHDQWIMNNPNSVHKSVYDDIIAQVLAQDTEE